jgi:hypothetical protein
VLPRPFGAVARRPVQVRDPSSRARAIPCCPVRLRPVARRVARGKRGGREVLGPGSRWGEDEAGARNVHPGPCGRDPRPRVPRPPDHGLGRDTTSSPVVTHGHARSPG